MDDIVTDPLDANSQLFLTLCAHLNSFTWQADATCAADLFSGGFKFSDEIPVNPEALGADLFPLVSVLRCLWGYRASVVSGKPRKDLAHYWEMARKHAPRWAGFSTDRSSAEMIPQLEIIERQAKAFVEEMDRLDREFQSKPSSLIGA